MSEWAYEIGKSRHGEDICIQFLLTIFVTKVFTTYTFLKTSLIRHFSEVTCWKSWNVVKQIAEGSYLLAGGGMGRPNITSIGSSVTLASRVCPTLFPGLQLPESKQSTAQISVTEDTVTA